ncbi:MAG TPA: hypothetical protein VKM55_00255 [Candidatus Lokiarchaeia archaeon]|nr:hypothetical protein [Candidatus Lokiarchaeia archaeon]
MKHAKIIALVVLAGILSINIASPAAAAATQWFPDSGTTIDYNYSMVFTFSNGTTLSMNRFNVYGTTAVWWIEPVYFSHIGFPFGVPLLASNVNIKLNHEYTTINSTTLNRTTSFVAGSNETSTCPMYLLNYETNFSASYFTYNSQAYHVIQKSEFFDNIFGDVLDYFNNNAEIGATVATYFHVTAITSTAIVYSYFSGLTNQTYVADTTGKVISYSMECKVIAPDIKQIEYLFEAQPTATSSIVIPVEWIIIACLVGIVTLLKIVIKKYQKS